MATTVPATPGERPGDWTGAISSKRLVSRAALAAAGIIFLGLAPAEAKVNKEIIKVPQVHNAQWFQHQKCLNDPENCPSPGRPPRPCRWSHGPHRPVLNAIEKSISEGQSCFFGGCGAVASITKAIRSI
jgi:hypothetical protein